MTDDLTALSIDMKHWTIYMEMRSGMLSMLS